MVFRAVDLAMKPRLSIAFSTGLIGLWVAAPPASDAEPCRHDKAHDCFQLPTMTGADSRVGAPTVGHYWSIH
jgi:hypothetical protein